MFFQRAALDVKNLTKITLQTFIAWKKRKLRERKIKAKQEDREKRKNVKSGKSVSFYFSFTISLLVFRAKFILCLGKLK